MLKSCCTLKTGALICGVFNLAATLLFIVVYGYNVSQFREKDPDSIVYLILASLNLVITLGLICFATRIRTKPAPGSTLDYRY